ncbi:MAG: hypothetical protein VX730_08060 [Pseudomonadota bacterium]|nr:hypothetical protein [Pseudomonadota bacterium]
MSNAHPIPMEDRRAIAKGVLFQTVAYILVVIATISVALSFMGFNNSIAVIAGLAALAMNLKFMHVRNRADALCKQYDIPHYYNVFAIARAIA